MSIQLLRYGISIAFYRGVVFDNECDEDEIKFIYDVSNVTCDVVCSGVP